jgi:hypothetical protein
MRYQFQLSELHAFATRGRTFFPPFAWKMSHLDETESDEDYSLPNPEKNNQLHHTNIRANTKTLEPYYVSNT